MRRRSLAGPVFLILIGALLLAYTWRPQTPVFDLISTYWPFLLIAWGLLRLLEVAVAAARGQPLGSSFSGGEVVLIVFICLIGSGMYSAHRHGVHFGFRGMDLFGEPYDYTVLAQKAADASPRIVFDCSRGNLRVSGGEAPEIRVSGRKTIRALNKSEADRVDQDSPLEIVTEGDHILVRTNQDRISDRYSISEDLDVSVPQGASIEARGRSGDYEITDLRGSVDLSSGRADVRLNKIGGNARVELRKSDLIRAIDVKGNLDLQGRGSDIELENVAGQVTINGSYSGSLDFKNLAKPLHFESPNTDLRVERLPGQISMDLGELTARNLIGPIRLITKSRDIKIEDFTNSLELETERGDIELQPVHLPLARIEARSRTGKIDLVLPDKAAFQLQATTDRGDAMNDFGPAIQKETEGHSATLKGAVGKGPTIHLSTQRGTVAVRKARAATSEAKL